MAVNRVGNLLDGRHHFLSTLDLFWFLFVASLQIAQPVK